MVQGMLAVVVFCMFGFCFYIANKIDQFNGQRQTGKKADRIKDTVFGHSFR